MLRPACIVLALVAFGGCATPDYIYRPTTLANAQIAGRVAADYPVPPEAPQGDVRIATFGLMHIRPTHATPAPPPNAYIVALHVRMILANNGSVPWTLDTREQHAIMQGLGESRAAYVALPAGSPPVVIVAPNEKRTVDLFFPLPRAIAEPKKLPEFDVLWQVQVGPRRVVERTPFERLRLVYDYYDGPYDTWAGPYFYDPFYPGMSFYGAAVPRIVRERPVLITPAQRVR